MFRVVFTYDCDQESEAMLTREELQALLVEPCEEDIGLDIYDEEGNYLRLDDLAQMGFVVE